MPVFVPTVTTEAQLDADIKILDGTVTSGNYTITFGANITEGNLSVSQDGTTVLPDLSAINLHTGVTLTINGSGNSLIGTNGTRVKTQLSPQLSPPANNRGNYDCGAEVSGE